MPRICDLLSADFADGRTFLQDKLKSAFFNLRKSVQSADKNFLPWREVPSVYFVYFVVPQNRKP